MRVLLDTSYLRRGPSGTGVYLTRLVPALRAAGVDVVEVADLRRALPGGGRVRSAKNLARDVLWTNLELPRLARRYEVDLIHHPLPAHASGAEVPQVVTVHDLAFEVRPDDFDRGFRRYAHHVHRAAATRAHAVVCVSAATAREAFQHWGLDAAKTVVAPHGPGQALPEVPRRADGGGHLLYVGDDEPRKDVDTLAAAAALGLPRPVVLAGRAERPGLRSVRAPSAAVLAELYAGAAALVHPSRHEGYGLTVLEALRLGVPVVAARTPAIEELCGPDAAVLFAPGDAEGLRRAVDEALARAEELAAAGRARAAGRTWARSAAAHVAAYALAAP